MDEALVKSTLQIAMCKTAVWTDRNARFSITTSEEMGNAFIEKFKPILKEENDGRSTSEVDASDVGESV